MDSNRYRDSRILELNSKDSIFHKQKVSGFPNPGDKTQAHTSRLSTCSKAVPLGVGL